MPKVAVGRRKRAYRPKTSSGCLTCKARHIKCDEIRPDCRRCTSTGRVCDGYAPVQLPNLSSLSTIRTPITVLVGPAIDIHACARSRRSFAFFAQRTRPEVAGFFGSFFWERLVLQAAHHEPAIRYAIIAIGSLHEQKTVSGDLQGIFALEQYNLAIRSLLAPLSQNEARGVDVCLILCILFASFENMRGNHASAGAHIRSGSKLLQETVYDQRTGALKHEALGSKCQPNCYVPLQDIAIILAGLDTEAAATMRDHKVRTYNDYFSGTILDNENTVLFSSVEEAKDIFEYGRCLMTSGSHQSSTEPPCDPGTASHTIQSHVNCCKALMPRFTSALKAFADMRGPLLTPQEDVAMAALELHVLNTYVSFCVDNQLPAYQGQQYELVLMMAEIVRLSEKLITSLSLNNLSKHPSASFCLDLGYIIPLFTVASRCIDKTLRRTAIDLLRSRSRQEGLWNSLVIARAAERILEIEESEGMPLVAYRNHTVSSSVPTVLHLDGTGVRLQYVKRHGIDTYDTVVEDICIW